MAPSWVPGLIPLHSTANFLREASGLGQGPEAAALSAFSVGTDNPLTFPRHRVCSVASKFVRGSSVSRI